MKIYKAYNFILGFLLVTLFFEFFLNLADISRPVFILDETKGDLFKPNTTVNAIFTMEGFGLNDTNSEGWLSKEVEKENASESIFFLGNSYVAGRHVLERNHFLTITENKLKENLNNKDINLYNYGKRDMSLGEVLYHAKTIDSLYKPKAIIVLLNETMLLTHSTIRLAPTYVLEDKELKLDISFKNNSKFNLYKKIGFLQNSSLVFMLYRFKNRLPDFYEIVFDKFYTKKEKNKKSITEEKIPVNELNMKIIEKLDSFNNVFFMTDIKKEKFGFLESNIQKSPTIYLSPTLDKMRNNGINPLYWKVTKEEGHWNSKAHQNLGDYISDYLIESEIFSCYK